MKPSYNFNAEIAQLIHYCPQFGGYVVYFGEVVTEKGTRYIVYNLDGEHMGLTDELGETGRFTQEEDFEKIYEVEEGMGYAGLAKIASEMLEAIATYIGNSREEV